MKVIIKFLFFTLFIFAITSCNKHKIEMIIPEDISADELLKIYFDGFYYVEQNKIVSVFPDFMKNIKENEFSQVLLEKNNNDMKDEYGDNFQISYTIVDKEKTSDVVFESIKKYVKNYENFVEPKECYLLNGILDIKGSKKTSSIIFNGEIAYCNFDGKWRLING